jgi:nitrogenase-associated protein
MAYIVFYEKPGCGGNARQKDFLIGEGHTLEVRNLLAWPWTRETLLEFLDELPVSRWFNGSAPRVKSGAIVPERLDREQALQLLLAEPLLIRRPLMSYAGRPMVGFEPERVREWLAQDAEVPAIEGCVALPEDR